VVGIREFQLGINNIAKGLSKVIAHPYI
jgi:hypothetical protein